MNRRNILFVTIPVLLFCNCLLLYQEKKQYAVGEELRSACTKLSDANDGLMNSQVLLKQRADELQAADIVLKANDDKVMKEARRLMLVSRQLLRENERLRGLLLSAK